MKGICGSGNDARFGSITNVEWPHQSDRVAGPTQTRPEGPRLSSRGVECFVDGLPGGLLGFDGGHAGTLQNQRHVTDNYAIGELRGVFRIGNMDRFRLYHSGTRFGFNVEVIWG